MSLHAMSVGEQGSRITFLHGLFGQGRNWWSIAKSLADAHRVVMLDLPDHGRSAWTASDGRFDYLAVADRVAQALDEQGEPGVLVGHSMGGKVAMVVALRHPGLVRRLVVADMSPVRYRPEDGEIGRYVVALNALDLDSLRSRADADARLADDVPDPGVRAFLLQNLRRDSSGDGWQWQANLALLERDLEVIGDWPQQALGSATYDGPVLWVAGGRSGYVRDDYEPAMARWFPRHRKVVVKQAGHWLHSEQPEIFTEIVRRFAAD